MPQKYLDAARAETIPDGWSGLWYVKKWAIKEPTQGHHERYGWITCPPGSYTSLFRLTDDTLYNKPPGEVVMEDTPIELKSHLDFMMRAYGRVLVTGLGLGCVVRGLLVNPNVEHITVLENSSDVLALVAEHMPKDERLSIVHADALEWTRKGNMSGFDLAYHDIWADRDNGQPHLDNLHMRLLFNCAKHVQFQFAWAFNRDFKRLLNNKGIKVL